MAEILHNFAVAGFEMLNRLSPYLLLGFFFAGVLHLFVSIETVSRHLGPRSFVSVLKGVLLGLPLPLCSCSVLPAAVSLRKMGATRGAVLSFLISAPITGIDSILATYSLMGLWFTIYRIAAAGAIALAAGLLANWLLPAMAHAVEHAPQAPTGSTSDQHDCCEHHTKQRASLPQKIRELFRYAFGTLLGEIWKPLLIGLLVGALISVLVPTSWVEGYLGNHWLAMLVMLAIGSPMYVCATGSIPIAAALMLKGLSPGAALVFLLSGPATNAVTVAVVTRDLGRHAMLIYLGCIAALSLLAGWLLDAVWQTSARQAVVAQHQHADMLPAWLGWLSSVILLLLIANAVWRKHCAAAKAH